MKMNGEKGGEWENGRMGEWENGGRGANSRVRARGTGLRAQSTGLRAQGTVTGRASRAGRANCTRPARLQDRKTARQRPKGARPLTAYCNYTSRIIPTGQ